MKLKKPYGKSFFWWLSVLIAATAILSVYFISQDPAAYDARTKINTILVFSAMFIGIIFVCATSNWWMKR